MLVSTLMNSLVERTTLKLIGTTCELTYESNTRLFDDALLEIGRMVVEEISVDNNAICATVNDYDCGGKMMKLFNKHPVDKRRRYRDFYH